MHSFAQHPISSALPALAFDQELRALFANILTEFGSVIAEKCLSAICEASPNDWLSDASPRDSLQSSAENIRQSNSR